MRITLTNEGDIPDQGIILKHKSGKLIIGKSQKDMYAKEIGAKGPAIIDFKRNNSGHFNFISIQSLFYLILPSIRLAIENEYK